MMSFRPIWTNVHWFLDIGMARSLTQGCFHQNWPALKKKVWDFPHFSLQKFQFHDEIHHLSINWIETVPASVKYQELKILKIRTFWIFGRACLSGSHFLKTKSGKAPSDSGFEFSIWIKILIQVGSWNIWGKVEVLSKCNWRQVSLVPLKMSLVWTIFETKIFYR